MAALDNDSDSELELEEKQFTIGAHTFQVHVVGELPLETLFALESKRDEISGQRAWPGSLLLAAEISARPALVEDRAVVELGAGAGLCAMVAARCGARMTAATDGDDRCLDLLRRNVAANGLDGVVSVAKCFWGRDAPPVGDLKTHASPTSWAARSSRARSPWRRRPCRRTGRQSIIKKTGLTTPVSTGATSNYVIADASEALVSVWRTSAAASWVFVNWAL